MAGSVDAVDVDLAFSGVGTLYRGYFGMEAAVGALGVGLGPCLEDNARVVITYDDEERIGRIVLDTDPQSLSCLATGAGGADVTAMTPVTRALAAYRDTIASSRDFRVASFRIGVTLRSGAKLCTAWAAGQYPPDGTTFSSCVTLAGVEKCMPGEHEFGVQTLTLSEASDQTYWAACNGL